MELLKDVEKGLKATSISKKWITSVSPANGVIKFPVVSPPFLVKEKKIHNLPTLTIFSCNSIL
jgi:hypothetical protein